MENMIVGGSVRLATATSKAALTSARPRANDVLQGDSPAGPIFVGQLGEAISAPYFDPHPGLDSARTP